VDKSTRRSVFILYIILFLLSTTTVSMVQISLNTSTDFILNIEYEKHTTTATDYSFDHRYYTISVNISVMVNDYESTLSSYRIGAFPLWIDTSDWANGVTVSISGNLFTISSESGVWKAHRSLSDFQYESLYYRKDLGILTRINLDYMSLGSSGFSGSEVETTIQSSNIDGFAARVTGSNLVGNIVLLTGIFTEILVVQWLYDRKQISRTSK